METIVNRFEHSAKIVLYILAGMLPLFLLPWPIGVEFSREVMFTIMGAGAVVLWFLSILTTGQVRLSYSPSIYAAMFMVLVFSVSAFFSKSAIQSIFFADPASEKLTTLILGVFFMIIVAGILKTRADVGGFGFILILSGGVSALLTAVQLLFGVSIFQYFNIGNVDIAFNVVGTLNALAIFYLVLLVLNMGLVLSHDFPRWKGWLRGIFILSSVLFFLDLLLIGFRTSWILLLVSMVVLFALMFQHARIRNSGSVEKIFDFRYWIIFGLLVFSIVMLLLNRSVIQINTPAEVHPSASATYSITKSVFQESVLRALLGSGPGTFAIDWALYKDAAINQTVFWSTRFNQGISWVATMASTVGVLGVLSFILFVGSCVYLFLKKLITSVGRGLNEVSSEFDTALFVAFFALVLSLFLYVGSFTLVLLFFIATGLLMSILALHKEESSEHFWDMRELNLQFKSPWAVFLSSLVVVFVISFVVIIFYYEVNRMRIAFAQLSGVRAFEKGDVDGAVSYFEKAMQIDSQNYLNYSNLLQVRAQQVQNLIQRANQGENVQQPFQETVSRVIQDARKLTELNPTEPIFWRNQAALYEMILPFIPGAERFAFEAYQRAIALDPKNPAIYAEWGRTGLVLADRIQIEVNRLQGGEREKAVEAHEAILKEVVGVLKKAVEVKQDFAPAHFMLAQTALRMGDTKQAIKSTEDAKLAAPFDIGIAFQLGLLYYQNNNLDKARAEFERAISLNGNYSNARYFLGLILDRKGDTNGAIGEFEKIEALNPDNQEVRKILANLRANRDALTGIVPPATPPEKRKDTPVR